MGQAQNWYAFASGIRGISYNISFAQGGRVRAEVYIDQGEIVKNKAAFDALLGQRDMIEREFGERLDWERLDNRRAARVAVYRDGTIEDPDERLAEIRTWSVNRLLKLKSVFGPRLAELSV